MAIKMASKVGAYCIIVVLIIALAGFRLGDAEQVAARWWRSVASSEALVMLHREMRSVLHRCTAMAIKMARKGGAFVRHRHLF
jgi:hypothetical protein